MPRRLLERTFSTPDVQGEGSFIRVRPATLGEALAITRAQEDRSRLWHRLGRVLARLLQLVRLRPAPRSSDLAREIYYDTIRRVSAWNWVDADGQPLPQPGERPAVVEQLTQAEFRAIQECVYGLRQSDETKN